MEVHAEGVLDDLRGEGRRGEVVVGHVATVAVPRQVCKGGLQGSPAYRSVGGMTTPTPAAPQAAYCDSCGERTATPPVCEDCRASQVDAAAKVLADGWQLSTGQGQFLLAEIDRLRATLARRGEEYDAVRAALEIEYGIARAASAARDDAEDRARYHQNKRSAEAREVADLRADRDRLAGQVRRVRAITEAGAEAVADLLAVPGVTESQLRAGLADVVLIQRRGLNAIDGAA